MSSNNSEHEHVSGLFKEAVAKSFKAFTESETMNFTSREKPQFRFPEITEELVTESNLREDSKKVKVLRCLLFFYTGQETTLGDIRQSFTEKAITFMEEDGYIKIF